MAALVRDAILSCCLFCLAIGSTIACCLFAYGGGVEHGIKAAAYFWMLSSLFAYVSAPCTPPRTRAPTERGGNTPSLRRWWRVTKYLIEEAFGPKSQVAQFVPVFRTKHEQSQPLVVPGLGEPGVRLGRVLCLFCSSCGGRLTRLLCRAPRRSSAACPASSEPKYCGAVLSSCPEGEPPSPARPVHCSPPFPLTRNWDIASCPASLGAVKSLSSVSPDRALASACSRTCTYSAAPFLSLLQSTYRFVPAPHSS